jgi:bacteriocin-like protein
MISSVSWSDERTIKSKKESIIMFNQKNKEITGDNTIQDYMKLSEYTLELDVKELSEEELSEVTGGRDEGLRSSSPERTRPRVQLPEPDLANIPLGEQIGTHGHVTVHRQPAANHVTLATQGVARADMPLQTYNELVANGTIMQHLPH